MAPFIRIGLRYLSGYLVARGFLAQSDAGLFNDPESIAAISYGGAALCAAFGEGWYALAKHFGWTK
jgi:hypothetical protein